MTDSPDTPDSPDGANHIEPPEQREIAPAEPWASMPNTGSW